MILSRLPTESKYCFDWNNKIFSKSCKCLTEVEKSHELSEYIAHYSGKEKDEKKLVLKSIIHTANTSELPKCQRYSIALPGNQSISLCMHGFRNLFILRKDTWKTLKSEIQLKGIVENNPHGNIGNKNQSKNSK